MGEPVNEPNAGRPGPFRWLWHALGGKLPQQYREWALHDATCSTWWLRHLAGVILRMLIPMAILFVVLNSFSGPLWLAFLSVSLGLIVAIYYALTYAPDSVDSRLTRYGYPAGTATAVRHESHAEENAEHRARYLATWRD